MSTTYCTTCEHNHTWQNMNGEPYQCDTCWDKLNKVINTAATKKRRTIETV